MKTQAIFDKVATHLLTQKETAMVNITCAYRVPGSKMKCAAGCLIPDELYQASFEGDVITDLLERIKPIKVFGFRLYPGQLMMIRSLQCIHDTATPGEWKNKLKELAAKKGLQFNPPKDAP